MPASVTATTTLSGQQRTKKGEEGHGTQGGADRREETWVVGEVFAGSTVPRQRGTSDATAISSDSIRERPLPHRHPPVRSPAADR